MKSPAWPERVWTIYVASHGIEAYFARSVHFGTRLQQQAESAIERHGEATIRREWQCAKCKWFRPTREEIEAHIERKHR